MEGRPSSGGNEREEHRRPGSRALLALSLVGAIALALFLGSSIMETAAGIAGIGPGTFRLVIKVAGFIIALPVAFYLVEKIFLAKSSRKIR